MSDAHTPKHFSTTALARAIGKDSKAVFILLAKSGWMFKVDGHWRLTEKGRFEGGEYINHPKFGEYIVWPEAIKNHAVLALLPEAPLSATSLAKVFHVPARLINLVLAERGWIKRFVRGWHLTEAGQAMGGQQQENETTGIPYVTWPESLVEHAVLKQALYGLRPAEKGQVARVLDGHLCAVPSHGIIDNWLYVAGQVHAVQYPLHVFTESGETELIVDFYLPDIRAAIMYWPTNADAGQLALQLTTRELLTRSHTDYIELEEMELETIDDVLSRELLKRNIAIY